MNQSFPCISSDRLLLRQIVAGDLYNVFKGLSHPEVIKFYGVSYKTLEETKAQLAFYKNLEETETGIYWAVCSKDDQTFYGVGGLNSVNRQHKKAEIGFWLLPEFWRQGIMHEAFPLICTYGFETLSLHRIEGFVETANLACKRGIEKLGFQKEGTMKDCEIKNGQFVSLDVYAKLSNK